MKIAGIALIIIGILFIVELGRISGFLESTQDKMSIENIFNPSTYEKATNEYTVLLQDLKILMIVQIGLFIIGGIALIRDGIEIQARLQKIPKS